MFTKAKLWPLHLKEVGLGRITPAASAPQPLGSAGTQDWRSKDLFLAAKPGAQDVLQERVRWCSAPSLKSHFRARSAGTQPGIVQGRQLGSAPTSNLVTQRAAAPARTAHGDHGSAGIADHGAITAWISSVYQTALQFGT